MTTKKHVVDGRVAVLISPGFGDGWSTWGPAELKEELLFDPGLVELVLANADVRRLEAYAKERWPEAYLGRIDQLEVCWVPEGEPFDVDEYEGSERLITGEREHRA